jgi:hypothetical protein
MVRDVDTPAASDGQPWQLQGWGWEGLMSALPVGEASKRIIAKNAIGCYLLDKLVR